MPYHNSAVMFLIFGDLRFTFPWGILKSHNFISYSKCLVYSHTLFIYSLFPNIKLTHVHNFSSKFVALVIVNYRLWYIVNLLSFLKWLSKLKWFGRATCAVQEMRAQNADRHNKINQRINAQRDQGNFT